MNTCDVLIVGCGVSGLYAAYKILKKRPDTKIIIAEKLTDIGGRIKTSFHGQHVLEYGPMRFEPELQPNFADLLFELGIKTKSFPAYTCPLTSPDFNSITLDEINAIHKYNDLPPAFALLKFGLSRILDDQWDVEGDNIHDHDRDARKQWLKREGMFQGRYLHQHGLWDTLAHVLSKPAIDFILHKGTFYHMLEINPNAADQICFMLDVIATSKYGLITIEGGSYRVIDELYNRVKDRVTISLNTCVTNFVEKDEGIEITTSKEIIQAKHVIFTCQQHAYSRIEGFDPGIRGLLDTVMVAELFKIFVIFDNPPFDENTIPKPNYQAHKVPCRELHFGYDKDAKTGLMMLYGDVPSINYWRGFDENIHLKNHLAHYLRQVFPNAGLCSILHYSIRNWSQEPYSCGVHLWKPGFRSDDIMHELSCFGKHKNLHVCGETYSNYQGFIEGSLRTVHNVVEHL